MFCWFNHALVYKNFISVEGVTCYLWDCFGKGGGGMCQIWIYCEGSEANIVFLDFYKLILLFFFSQRRFRHYFSICLREEGGSGKMCIFVYLKKDILVKSGLEISSFPSVYLLYIWKFSTQPNHGLPKGSRPGQPLKLGLPQPSPFLLLASPSLAYCVTIPAPT